MKPRSFALRAARWAFAASCLLLVLVFAATRAAPTPPSAAAAESCAYSKNWRDCGKATPRADSARSAQLAPATTAEFTITASELYAAYRANEVSADDRFRGHVFEVRGIAGRVGKNFADEPYVELDADDGLPVIAFVKSAELLAAGRVRRDSYVSVLCRGAGAVLTAPQLVDCSFLAY